MARGTLLRRGLVKKDCLAFDRTRQFVATFTAHGAVCAFQPKRSSLVVVKQRWLPPGGVMTPGARCRSSFGKLPAMDIRVACFTLRRGQLEIHLDEPGSWVRWCMAIDTLPRLVGAAQGKRGL